MAYDPTNLATKPSHVNRGGLDNSQSADWDYVSPDAAAVVAVSGYFTDAYKLGMKTNDLIRVTNTTPTPSIITEHTINMNGTVCDLSDGVVLGSATNAG